VVAPEATTIKTDDLTTGTGAIFSGQGRTGSWTSAAGRLAGSGSEAVQQMTFGVAHIGALSLVEVSAKMSLTGQGGFVFDRYGVNDYKFVLLDAATDKVLIGHRTAKGTVIDATLSKTIDTGVDYTLGTVLKGSTVSVTLNGQVMLSFAYNAALADGGVGLLSRSGITSFDTVTLKTNDAAVAAMAPVQMAMVTSTETTPLSKTMAAAPEQEYAVNSGADAVSFTAKSNIDWSGRIALPVQPAGAAGKAQEWHTDFVTQLGRTEAERNPNASLKIQVTVAPKLKAELSALHARV
jgi:hypothetical protein